jgi:hypothetical protein
MVGGSEKLRGDDGQACGWMMGRQGSDDVVFIFIFHSLFFLSALGPSNFPPTGQGGHSVGKFGSFFWTISLGDWHGLLAGWLVALGEDFLVVCWRWDGAADNQSQSSIDKTLKKKIQDNKNGME